MNIRLLTALLTTPIFVIANPSDPSVAHGDARFETNGKQMNISTSDKAIIHWKNFSIDRDEKVRFIQPNEKSSVLNRVISSDPSRIMGSLEANGQIFLINPNGILVGSSGQIQSASFIGSTFDVLNEDFLKANDLHFQGTSSASFVNEGSIEATDGDLVFISKTVENHGKLSALSGFCGLGCGESILLKPEGDQRLFILIPVGSGDAAIKQEGTIESLSAEIKAAGSPFSLAISHTGKIDALGVRKEGGNVFLVAEQGDLFVSGEIRAEAGNVHLHGDSVVLDDQALIDVSSSRDAGTVYIGNDPLCQTQPNRLLIRPGARIDANSSKDGNGGNVVLWANESNEVYGTITAKGGSEKGDGGFVEISSASTLVPKGFVDTRASFGKTGKLLFDPCAVTISSGATTVGVSPFGPPGGCPMPAQSYTFGALAAATINNTDLVGYLTCNNVTIDASATGGLMTPGSITVSDPVIWPGGGPMAGTLTSLELIADGTITINASIIAEYINVTASNAIRLDAPTVDIVATGGDLDVRTYGGNIDISAPTDLLLTGTAGDVTVLSAGAISIGCGNLNMTNPVAANRCVISGGTAVNATITGDCDLAGAGGSQIGCTGVGATTTANISGHLHITGGTGANTLSAFGSNQGPTDLTVGQDIRLESGTGMGNAGARISAGVLVGSTANLIIRSATDIVLDASMATLDSPAEIGTGDFNLFAPGGNGTVSITYSGNLSITGGTADGCFAGIRTNGTVGATTNHISITATNGASTITMLSQGGASTDANASIQTFEGGNITISNAGNLAMTGSSATNPAIIQTGPNAGNLSITNSGTSTLNSFTTIETQASGAALGFSGGNLSLLPITGLAEITGNLGPVTVSLNGSLGITGGMGVPGRIISAETGGTGNLTVTANDITMTAGTAAAFALLSVGTFGSGGAGEAIITATGPGGITLNGGTGMSSGAFIGTFGTASTNHITVNVTDPAGNLTMNSTDGMSVFASAAILTGGTMGGNGNITLNVANDFIMTGASLTSPSFIQTNFTMGAAAGSDILILAGRTINMGAFTNIQNTHIDGITTLVVDNNFPTPPLSGPGQFILDTDAFVTTASASGLFIYTADPTQNIINGSINGPFLGVNLLVNGPNEQWGIYYPDNPNNVTGTPYTIFYKFGYEELVPIIFTLEDSNDLTRAINEAFNLWKTYDRYVYVVKQMEVSFGEIEETEDLIKKNRISSYDLPSWFYTYFYRSQRNYNTLKLENRL